MRPLLTANLIVALLCHATFGCASCGRLCAAEIGHVLHGSIEFCDLGHAAHEHSGVGNSGTAEARLVELSPRGQLSSIRTDANELPTGDQGAARVAGVCSYLPGKRVEAPQGRFETELNLRTTTVLSRSLAVSEFHPRATVESNAPSAPLYLRLEVLLI